jgi:hypothetical protein
MPGTLFLRTGTATYPLSWGGGDGVEPPPDPEPAAMTFAVGDAATAPGVARAEVANHTLRAPQHADLATGPASFWFAAFVRWDVVDGGAENRMVLTKWDGSGNEIWCGHWTASGVITFILGSNTGDRLDTIVPEVGREYFVFICYDAATKTMGISLDGGALTSRVLAAHPTATAANLDLAPGLIGAYRDAAWGKPAGSMVDLAPSLIARLYNGGMGIPYAWLSADEKATWGLISCWPLTDPTDLGADVHGGHDLTITGDPAPTVATEASRRAWEGDPVAAMGDGWAAVGGPLEHRTWPERLLAYADAPGVATAAPDGAMVGAFDVILQGAPILGTAQDLWWLTFPNGAYRRGRVDASLVYHVDGAGADGTPIVTRSGNGPLYGQSGVTGGTVGRASFEGYDLSPPFDPITFSQSYAELEVDGPLPDAIAGMELDVAGCGPDYDGTRHVSGHWHDGTTWRVRFHLGADKGPDYVADPPTAGTVTPTGRQYYQAQEWSGDKHHLHMRCLRVFSPDGDAISFSCNNTDLGTATGDPLPPIPSTGGTLTLGAIVGGDAPPELPRWMYLVDGPLTGPALWSAKARAGIVVTNRDGWAGTHCHVRVDYIPGIAFGEMVHADVTTTIGDATSWQSSDGLNVTLFVGDEYQAEDTTHPIKVAYHGIRWDMAGDPSGATMLGEVDAGVVTRRARPMRFVGPAGSDGNDGTTSGAAWATIARALAASPTGALVQLLDGGAYGGTQIRGHRRPIGFAPVEGNPYVTAEGGGQFQVILVDGDSVGVHFRGISTPTRTNFVDWKFGIGARGCAVRKSRSVNPLAVTPGEYVQRYGVAYVAVSEFHLSASTDQALEYVVGYSEGTRWCHVGDGVAERAWRYHPIRPQSSVGEELARLDFQPAGPPYSGPESPAPSNVALRQGTHWANVHDCRFSDYSVVELKPASGEAVVPKFNLTEPNPNSVGISVRRCSAGSILAAAPCGLRITGCGSNIIDLAATPIEDTRQTLWPTSVVVEACQANTITLDAGQVRANPPTGPRANDTPYNSANPLAAPTPIDLGASAPGYLAVDIPPPLGGTGSKEAVLEIDGVEAIDRAGGLIYLPASPGSHTGAVTVTDAAAATDPGEAITVVVS